MQRQSNIELLRIVSMLMVLAVHVDGASLGLPEPMGDIASLTAHDVWRIVVEAVAIIGVNCFTMISGYFGVRLRLRGVLSFLFQCAFYSVGIYTVVAIVFPGQFSWQGWLESWMVLTHTDLWYVPAYFGLMLLSPVLNAGLDALPKRTFAVRRFQPVVRMVVARYVQSHRIYDCAACDGLYDCQIHTSARQYGRHQAVSWSDWMDLSRLARGDRGDGGVYAAAAGICL